MSYKISNIFVSSGQKTGSAGEIFIAQPDEYKDSLAGRLFILLDIESSKSKALKVANFLVDNINYNYYQNEKLILREKIKSITVEHIFETTLTKVNKDLIDFLNQEKIKISPYSLNITVGVIHGSELYFSSVGKNKNLLIYPQKRPDSQKNQYSLNDVGESQKKQTQSTSLLKLFSDVVSGTLPEDGYYLLTNEALKEYLSEKQIIDIITKLPPASAGQHIENILKQLNINALFLGLIIKNTSGSLKISLDPEEENRRSEALDLNQTRRKTEEIMQPAGIINFGKIKVWTLNGLSSLKNLGSYSRNKISPTSKPGPDNIPSTYEQKKPIQLKEKMFFQKKSGLFSGGKIIEGLKTGILGAVSIIVYVVKFFSSFNNIKKLLLKSKNLPGFLKNKLINFLKFLAGLNLKSKLTLVVIILFLGAFVFSTSFYIKKNKQEEALNSMDNLISSIEKNQNKIEANLLYSNEKDAQEIIEDNQTSLELLEKKVAEYNLKTEKYQELKNIHKKQEKEIMRLEIITEDLKLVKDLSSTGQTGKNLILWENNLYLADANNSQIHKLSLEDESLSSLETAKKESLSYPVENQGVIYYFSPQEAITIDTETEESNNIEINLPSGNELKNSAEFGNNIYLLDSGNNQIYKFSNPSAGLGSGQNWLAGENDLNTAQDLAIDGYIYVLKNQEVKKYLKGSEEDFKIENPYPSLEEATRIQVSPEIDKGYIYILEPAQERLLIFNKEGEFQKQYQSPSFKNLKDFQVDEENNIIYFLAGNSVFKYSFED